MAAVIVDDLTAARVRMLAEDLNLTQAEIVRRAVEIFTMARQVGKGLEAGRNESEGESDA